MTADGKSAEGGSEQDDKEDFGEASGRSNGGPKKKKKKGSEDRFGRRFLGCVEDRIEIARKSIRQFWGEIDRRKILCSQELS
jgi:hypothetical protein